MSAPLEKNVDYPLLGGLAVEQHPPLSSTNQTIPCFTTPRIYFEDECLHVATLLCPDPALIHELRQKGFRIPALDEDQDRR